MRTYSVNKVLNTSSTFFLNAETYLRARSLVSSYPCRSSFKSR